MPTMSRHLQQLKEHDLLRSPINIRTPFVVCKRLHKNIAFHSLYHGYLVNFLIGLPGEMLHRTPGLMRNPGVFSLLTPGICYIAPRTNEKSEHFLITHPGNLLHRTSD